VLLEAEDPPVVKTNPLEDPVAVEQAVVEHRNLRVLFAVKFSVNIDLHVGWFRTPEGDTAG